MTKMYCGKNRFNIFNTRLVRCAQIRSTNINELNNTSFFTKKEATHKLFCSKEVQVNNDDNDDNHDNHDNDDITSAQLYNDYSLCTWDMNVGLYPIVLVHSDK